MFTSGWTKSPQIFQWVRGPSGRTLLLHVGDPGLNPASSRSGWAVGSYCVGEHTYWLGV